MIAIKSDTDVNCCKNVKEGGKDMTETTCKKWKSSAMVVLSMVLVVIALACNSLQSYAHDYSTAITVANDKSSDIYVKVTRHSGSYHDWQEYGYSITNNSNQAVNGVTITVPTTGSVTSFKCWGMTSRYTNGAITITHTQTLNPGETFTCTNDQKFGYSGGGLLSTPAATIGASAESATGLKYSVVGTVKNVAYAETPVGQHGALSVKKVAAYAAPTIVDKAGKAVQLRTVSTHGVQWFPGYVNKAAFQSLRDEWGINAVRLALYPREGGYLQGNQSLMDSKIEEGVEAAKELGMYVIIDWHVLSYNPNEDLESAKTFFKKYATKYKDYNNVIFEICNEPTGTPWYNGSGNDLYTYCKKVSQVIRDCGNDSIIICGTNDWSQRVDEVATKPLKNDGFENIMYSIHFYAATHYDNIKNNFKSAIASGTPVFASEFSACDASGNGGYDFDNADDWMRLFKENNISYACWSLCNKAESASLLSSSCSKTSGWTASDLSENGVWLINTSRALADEEPGVSAEVVPEGTEEVETEVVQESTSEAESEEVQGSTEETEDVQESTSEVETEDVQESVEGEETEERTESEESKESADGAETGTAQSGCTGNAQIMGEWNNGCIVNGYVNNNGIAVVDGWTMAFDFNGEITNIWCAKIVSHVGNHYVIEAESYNKQLQANGTATFGFCASKEENQQLILENISVQ